MQQPLLDKKNSWVRLTFLDAVGQEPVIGCLVGETADAYALKDTDTLYTDDDGRTVRKVVETNVRFYQKHAVFCMEMVDLHFGVLSEEEVEEP